MSSEVDSEREARRALAALLDREADPIAAAEGAAGSVEALAAVVDGEGERRLRGAILAAERAGEPERAAAGRSVLAGLRRLRRAARRPAAFDPPEAEEGAPDQFRSGRTTGLTRGGQPGDR